MDQEESIKPNVIIPSHDLVTFTRMNHIVEIQHMEKRNNQANIRKINKDEYVVLETGEIKEFNHIEHRAESYNSLRQTFKKLRYLTNNNFSGRKNELHVILTYAENMTDSKRLMADSEKFVKRLRYQYRNDTKVEYLSVVEPQGRGSWHIHMLIRFDQLEKIYIDNKELASTWGHGFVTIRSLKDVDNIGAYLTAYLTNAELTQETLSLAAVEKREIVEKIVDGKQKKFIKGGRLHMYPPGMNLFRKSNGIEYPIRENLSYKNALKKVGSVKPHYVKSIDIKSDTFENTITYEQYNLKR